MAAVTPGTETPMAIGIDHVSEFLRRECPDNARLNKLWLAFQVSPLGHMFSLPAT